MSTNGVHSEGGEGGVPRLRIITADEVDGLAELKEPVEAQAREQAREILEDIKVRPARLMVSSRLRVDVWVCLGSVIRPVGVDS